MRPAVTVMAWDLLVPFTPVAKARARTTWTHQGPRHYTPEATVDWEALVGTLARARMGRLGAALLEGPVELALAFRMPVPESWAAWKRDLALAGAIAPTSKPDLDNLEKGVKDALNRIAWRDDAQVVRVTKDKAYAAQPGVLVTVTPLSLLPAQVSRRPSP